jgi:hypothetical protein
VSTIDSKQGAPFRWATVRGAAMLVAIAGATLGVCHGSGTEGAAYRQPIPECLAYADTARPCFGDRAAERLHAAFSIRPTGRAARRVLLERCMAETAELRRVCR